MRESSALFTLLFLVGCSGEGRFPEKCGTRLSGWKQPSDGYGVLAVVNKVRVLKNGALKWNGRTITSDQLGEYSAIVPTMNPIPFTILDIEAGAPCGVVTNTRRVIEVKAKCGAMPEASKCGEGAGPWSIIGDVVGPDGKPVIVGTEEDFFPKENRSKKDP